MLALSCLHCVSSSSLGLGPLRLGCLLTALTAPSSLDTDLTALGASSPGRGRGGLGKKF